MSITLVMDRGKLACFGKERSASEMQEMLRWLHSTTAQETCAEVP